MSSYFAPWGDFIQEPKMFGDDFGDEFGDIFVTLFDDSPNWVMILVTFLSPYSSLNLVVNKFVTKIMTNFTTTKKSSHAA